MGFAERIAFALLAPIAPFRAKGKTLSLTAAYTVAATIILLIVGALLISNQQALRDSILSYVLPESWIPVGNLLVDRFFATQSRWVLLNAVVSGTLVMISVLLFPLKEKVSAAFETEAKLTTTEHNEPPLWFQALEEVKLVLIYVAAQMTIFWIGYAEDPSRKQLAAALSFLYLALTFAVDFISPLLQRHGLRYSQILKHLAMHPFVTLFFGTFFAGPTVLIAKYIALHPQRSFTETIVILFSVNLVMIVWAVLSGTWLASRMLPTAEKTERSVGPVRAIGWVALFAVLGVNSYAFGSVARSIHHKSQILKLTYVPDPTSFRLHTPSLVDLVKIAKGELTVGVGFKLLIKNPTKYDVDIENNRLEVKHGPTLVASTKIKPFSVKAGEQSVESFSVDLSVNPLALKKGRDLLKDKWHVTLYLQVSDSIEFPIYLRSMPGPKSAATSQPAKADRPHNWYDDEMWYDEEE